MNVPKIFRIIAVQNNLSDIPFELYPVDLSALTLSTYFLVSLFDHHRHAREGGHPAFALFWIPAFAGMTGKRGYDGKNQQKGHKKILFWARVLSYI